MSYKHVCMMTMAAMVAGLTVTSVPAQAAPVPAPAAESPPPAPVRTVVTERPAITPGSGGDVELFTTSAVKGKTALSGQHTALLAAAPTVAKGTGPTRSGTFLDFELSDKIAARINVASGNLLIQGHGMTLPGISGDVTLGTAFNSLLLGTTVQNGQHGPGWRTRGGGDVRLYPASDGSVTFINTDGVVGKFTSTSATAYTTPGEFKGKLVKDGSVWKYTDHGSGSVTLFTSTGYPDKVTDRNGNVVDYAYSGAKLYTVTGNRGPTAPRSAAVTYNSDGTLLTKYTQTGTDSSTRVLEYTYNSLGRLSRVTYPSGRTTNFGYNSAGDMVGMNMGDDTYMKMTYDGQHRITSFTQVSDNTTMQGATTRLAYPTSTQTKVADGNQDLAQAVADVPHTTYDSNGDERVTKVTNPAGYERSRSYTPFHDVATSVSAEQGTTTNSFDANSGESQTKSASPTGASSSVAYGAASSTNPTGNFQPSSSVDRQKNTSKYTYNGAGNPTSAGEESAAKAEVDYNPDGTVKSSTDPGNGTNRTTYTYDTNKQLTKITAPTGNTLVDKTFTYDGFGRLKTSGGACTTTFTYDADDRMTRSAYSGCATTTDVTYAYGPQGYVYSRTDGSGTTTYGRDRLNRLRERTGATGGMLKYVYDPVGNMVELTDGRGTTKYYHNNQNLLVRLDTAGGTRYNFAYDKDGNRKDTWFGTDTANSTWAGRMTTAYDKSDRPSRITTTRNSASPVKVFDTSYCYAKYVSGSGCSTDPLKDTGLRQWKRDELVPQISTYAYDKSNRLTSASHINGKLYEYTYDARGNRTTVKVDSTSTQSLAFNSANQVTTTNNTFNGRGDQTRASTPATTTMGFNGAGHMTSASAAASSTYGYAGGDQVELTSLGSISMVYGVEDQHGMPWLQSWTNGTTTVYVERDGQGAPLGLRIGSTDYMFVTDGLGSVVGVVSAADKTVKATYTYDPYGTVTASSETGLPTTNLIRYAAGTYDPTTTYTKYGQRWYNPTQGRFTQQDSLSFIGDPAKGNRYAYAGANPVNYIDPTGQEAVPGGGHDCKAGFCPAKRKPATETECNAWLTALSFLVGVRAGPLAAAGLAFGGFVISENFCGRFPE